MKLEEADELGAEMLAALAPACERIMIAGSVRRRRSQVNDLDIVLMPKASLAEVEFALRESPAKLEKYGQGDNWIARVRDGKLAASPTDEGFQVDIWLAKPRQGDLFSLIKSTWGTILLCRTGSMAHNIQLASLANSKKLKWSPYRGLIDPKTEEVIASETEEDIYEALGLEWRPPEDRECL